MKQLTAVKFRRGRGGRTANESLPVIQVETSTSILSCPGQINKRGALDVIRQDHNGMTTLTFFFATEEAASKFEKEFESTAEPSESLGLSLLNS